MAQFMKKPVTIEAFRWTGGPDQAEDPVWICEAIAAGTVQFVEAGFMSIHTTEGVMNASPGDWIIQGVEGELYPCKDSVFQATYAPAGTLEVSALSFGDALVALKTGARICRAGWNGKGAWLSLSGPLPGREIAFENFWSTNNSEYARLNGGSATVLPCITMKTATGEILMGWLASQTDMLADDWMVVA